MTEIRWVDREILTNEGQGTSLAPLRCPDFEAFLSTNIVLNQYDISIHN